ncbi:MULTISPECIES: CHASE2 domain-containing protein [unclassified Xanthobacter]|uniref:CHASE2 domain-containing protein n=1 Tax=unclassified Xanthobacter TaxID=2623496 RepID=UPI001EDF6752|nr:MULTISPECIES: adenylate/guanylate cyclase domain-containing protein [unclassified Xanthobacter]
MGSRLYWLATLGALLAGLALLVLEPAVMGDVRNDLFDAYQRADPPPFDADLPVRIVDIDDAALARVGQWPWPRTTLARLVDQLAAAGAAVVAFDMVFAEPDRLDPARIAAELPAEIRPRLAALLADREPSDARLARAFAAVPTVLGAVLTQGPGGAYPVKWGLAVAGDDPVAQLPHFSGAVAPLPEFAQAAAGIGALNWLPDRDQVVRRVPLLLDLDGRLVPGLAAEALRVAQGASTYLVRATGASGESAFGAARGLVSVRIGAFTIPADAAGAVRVRFGASDPHRFVSAADVLEGRLADDAMAGRIVLVGTSAAGLKDTRATPIAAALPGVEVQAQLLEHMLRGARLVRPDWARGAELALAALLGLGLALALPRVPALAAGAGVALVLGALAAGSWLAFRRADLLLDPMGPAATALLVYGVGVLALYRQEQRQKAWVRAVFGRFVAPAVVARLAEAPDRLALGGETRELTILFCDLRDFTTLSETLDAQALTRFMNAYLTPMTEVVLAHGGTIDKYIGDAIMAFWNAPLDEPAHARKAALCALALVRRLEALNADWRAAAEREGRVWRPVRCGVGLATGPCCVGNLGSEQRLEYSCLGDDVNLASRIEGATKGFHTDILVSEATRAAAGSLAFLEVGALTLKGKSRPSRLFLLAGDAAFASSEGFRLLAQRHQHLLATQAAGERAAVRALAAELARSAPERLRPFYEGYGDRSA